MSKRLGQHILCNKDILNKIIEVANISNHDTIFEIGSGNGILTEELCKRAKHVIATELDERFYKELTLLASKYNNLEVYNTDGFKLASRVRFNKFVSNIPYSRSKDTIELLSTKEHELSVIMVQKEFADKLINGKKAISIIARYCFDIEKICNVSRYMFKPIPAVDSSLLLLRKKNNIDQITIKRIKLLYSIKKRKAKHATKLSFNISNELRDTKIEDLKVEEVMSIIRDV